MRGYAKCIDKVNWMVSTPGIIQGYRAMYTQKVYTKHTKWILLLLLQLLHLIGCIQVHMLHWPML